MQIKKRASKDYVTTQWSGGTTTEMLLYPENASYAERRFGFRISSAVLQVPTSVFTYLEGIKRRLILLDGSITLDINGQYVSLKPFDFAEFGGEDKVTSQGLGRDLNIMTSPGFSSRHTSMTLRQGEESVIHASGFYTILYIASGEITAAGVPASAEELLVLSGAESGEMLAVRAASHIAEMVVIEILLQKA